jgi:hypothetical protein
MPNDTYFKWLKIQIKAPPLFECAESHYDLGREKMFALLDDLIHCAH